jgi:hypothetical protein
MDLRVVRIYNSVPVQSVRVIEGVSPATIDIRGSGFLYAEEVFVNDIYCPSFAVIDDNRILAELPDIGMYEITSVVVWVTVLNRTGRNKLVPGLGMSAATTSGMELLIQRFVKFLLSTPGTDAWGSEGGGLQVALRSPTDKKGSSVTTSAAIAIATAREYLSGLDVPSDEKLDDLQILNMSWNPENLGLYVDVSLTNVAGQKMQTTLGFGDG